MMRSMRPGSGAFENVQTASAIDEIDQTAVVVAHIITLHARRARWHIRYERGDFARGMGIGDIHDAKAVREPRDGDLAAADILTELMHPGVVHLGRAVFLGHLKA